MSVTLPESVDAWRMISARRSFQGKLPIASMGRLVEALASNAGVVQYELDFFKDASGVACLEARINGSVLLTCQRTLQVFELPVVIDARLGLISTEQEEASLPTGVEPLLVAEDGRLSLGDVIEDELLLALPLVPIKPGSVLPGDIADAADVAPEQKVVSDNPFAILRELKKSF